LIEIGATLAFGIKKLLHIDCAEVPRLVLGIFGRQSLYDAPVFMGKSRAPFCILKEKYHEFGDINKG
jgi:hypothetical protein